MAHVNMGSWGSSVSIMTRLRHGKPGFDSRQGLRHRVQTGSDANPASYLTVNGASFPRRKVDGTWRWPLTSTRAEVKNAWSYTATPQ